MKTVSLELAVKLKAAGLKWEPKWGDMFFDPSCGPGINNCTVTRTNKNELYAVNQCLNQYNIRKRYAEGIESMLWFPTTDDLLDWLEGEGYTWEMGLTTIKGGPMMPGEWKYGYWMEVFKQSKSVYLADADIRPDAAGEAVLHVLGQKGANQKQPNKAI